MASTQQQQQQHAADAAWPGFSPAPGPMSITMSPDQSFGFGNPLSGGDNMSSPLVFKRTPGQQLDTPSCPDSSKRFNSWVQSTSPYAGRKTPPTASMKSVAPATGGEENTPPARDGAEGCASVGGRAHFQAWLRATNSTSWTPRRSPAAATPPPAPAPSPAAPTPMSIMRELPPSAATPASSQQQQRQHQPGGASSSGGCASDGGSSDDDDFGEASTTVGVAELDAAARRAAAAQRIAAAAAAVPSARRQAPSGPGRAPAPTPTEGLTSPPLRGEGPGGRQVAADSLATPLSQLSLGRRQAATTPVLAEGGGLGASLAAAAHHHASSPAEKLIGLMLSPAAGDEEGAGGRHARHRHHAQQQQHTPSRLSGAVGGGQHRAGDAPLSPNLQLISLMMEPAAAANSGGADDSGPTQHTAGEAAGSDVPQQQQQQQQQGAVPADGRAASDAGVTGGSGDDDCDADAASCSSSLSGDEMDVAELQALCGNDTPLSAILGMMLTPQACGLTTGLAGPAAAEAAAAAAADDLNPRVLFADADD